MSNLLLPFEVWRPVIGYENIYIVSSRGNFMRLPKPLKWFKKRKTAPFTKLEIHQLNGSGKYFTIGLRKDNKTKTFFAHRIQFASFYGAIPEGMEINHKDLDKKNNFLPNLELTTPKQNTAHAIKNIGNVGSNFIKIKGIAIKTDGTEIIDFNSLLEISRIIKAKVPNISRAIDTNKIVKGYTFKSCRKSFRAF